MGREANVMKDRKCDHCGRPLLATAKMIKEHAQMCARLQRIGLVVPSVERPESRIIVP